MKSYGRNKMHAYGVILKVQLLSDSCLNLTDYSINQSNFSIFLQKSKLVNKLSVRPKTDGRDWLQKLPLGLGARKIYGLLQTIRHVKFRYCEKIKKFEKISHFLKKITQ